MGRYDDITPDELRADLRYFAQLILRLDERGDLLRATPRLLKILGELRSKLFAHEVRGTKRLAPRDEEPPEVAEAIRIVEEAIRRAEAAEREWGRPYDPEDENP